MCVCVCVCVCVETSQKGILVLAKGLLSLCVGTGCSGISKERRVVGRERRVFKFNSLFPVNIYTQTYTNYVLLSLFLYTYVSAKSDV